MSRTAESRFGRRIGMATAATAMIAATLWAGATAANAEPDHCNVGNVNNGQRWESESTSGNGWAEFYENGKKVGRPGEWLRVADRRSNGTRAEVELQHCASGEVRYLDSGPDEGVWDQEWYPLPRSEGEVIMFRVCDKRGHACGPWVYANA